MKGVVQKLLDDFLASCGILHLLKKKIGVIYFAAVLSVASYATFAAGSIAAEPTPTTTAEPLLLDLSPYFWMSFVIPVQTNNNFPIIGGRPIIDGVPFQVEGRAVLYGKQQGGRNGSGGVNSLDILGLKVSRTFDELHLLHATRWADLEGQTIALIRLNYSDGTRHEFPIGYGVHVRDWQRLQTEETERLSDTHSKIIWRGSGITNFRSTQRIFKTMLVNPFPGKLVSTIDFVSTGQIASYQILAATLVNHDDSRPVTPAVPSDTPERHFDGSLDVRVEDPAGNPIPDVWVYPEIEVPGTGYSTIRTPFYTTTNGAGVVRYPKGQSPSMWFLARKAGWKTTGQYLRFITNGVPVCGAVMVIRLEPVISPTPTLVANPPGTNPTTVSVASTTSASNAIATLIEPLQNAGASAPAATASVVTGEFRPHVILMIDFPAGSNVRVDFASNLSSPDWQPLTTITNLLFSPYPFDCVCEDPTQSQRFYRATLLP